nr:Retrovirus-related Pol polyprotein from transposon RE1 [Ipomoea batatas]
MNTAGTPPGLHPISTNAFSIWAPSACSSSLYTLGFAPKPRIRVSMLNESSIEGAFKANDVSQNQPKGKNKKQTVEEEGKSKRSQQRKVPTLSTCKKTSHLEKYRWFRFDVKYVSCNQMGHVKKRMHQSHDFFYESLFTEIDQTVISKVKIGNGQYIEVKCKGTVAMERLSGIKVIPNVMLVPEISQNLLSVGQLLEKGKLKVCRDIKFDERWNWDKNKLFENIKEESGELLENERIDDIHVRGTRSLAEIYERRNVAVLEPLGYDDAIKDPCYKRPKMNCCNGGGDEND